MKKIDKCKNPTYREDILDNIVIKEILNLAINPDQIESIKKNNYIVTDDKPSILQSRIVEIDKQINKLMDLYQFGTIPLTEIHTRIEPLHKERKQIESELSKYKEINKPELSVEKAKEIIKNAEKILKNESRDVKRCLLDQLINKIEILENGIKIYWKFIQ
jgi:site-specific DNA recombinase